MGKNEVFMELSVLGFLVGRWNGVGNDFRVYWRVLREESVEISGNVLWFGMVFCYVIFWGEEGDIYYWRKGDRVRILISLWVLCL